LGKPFRKTSRLFHHVVEAVEGLVEVDVCVDCRMKMNGKEREALVN
jgi:hypothetical protein